MAGRVSRLLLGVACAAALTAGVDGQSRVTDWRSSNYDGTSNRYSPLDQITPQNVAKLERVWSIHLKPESYTQRLREMEAIPLVIGNMMYLASPYGAILALDATTGAEKWKFQLPDSDLPAKRGMAYWPGADGVPASLFFGGTRGGLYSIKASDGSYNTGFGVNGVLNLKTPEVMVEGMEQPYSLLSSPTIYKNLVIIGAGTGEGAGGSNAGTGPAGDTRAFDAKTGKLVWTFHTVPRPGEFGYDTWGENSARNRSGVNTWGYMSVDEARGIVYMPLGAPNNDRVGTTTSGTTTRSRRRCSSI
jgi:glucose dehydrogenase